MVSVVTFITIFQCSFNQGQNEIKEENGQKIRKGQQRNDSDV